MNKIDLLAFGAHPDDVELSAGGTIIKHVQLGFSCGIIDLTKGELGTRGTSETRIAEANEASKILGLSLRENLNLPDGFIRADQESIVKVIQIIRKYQPKIVLANAPSDRHPDHGRAAELVKEACFLSGLRKIVTHFEGKEQTAHRPLNLFHYIQDNYLEPSFVIDISANFQQKLKGINAYKTQFFQENSTNNEPSTPISGKDFYAFLEARARDFGRKIQVEFAEGFISNHSIGVNNLFEIS